MGKLHLQSVVRVDHHSLHQLFCNGRCQRVQLCVLPVSLQNRERVRSGHTGRSFQFRFLFGQLLKLRSYFLLLGEVCLPVGAAVNQLLIKVLQKRHQLLPSVLQSGEGFLCLLLRLPDTLPLFGLQTVQINGALRIGADERQHSVLNIRL